MDGPELKIIDVFICELRKKLSEAIGRENHSKTVWGRGYALRDPKQEQIADVLRGQETAEGIYNALTALPGLFPDPLLESAVWRETVVAILDTLLTDGVAATIAAEANRRQHQQV